MIFLQNGIANRAGAEPVLRVPTGPQNPGNPGGEPDVVPPPPTANTPAPPRTQIHAPGVWYPVFVSPLTG